MRCSQRNRLAVGMQSGCQIARAVLAISAVCVGTCSGQLSTDYMGERSQAGVVTGSYLWKY